VTSPADRTARGAIGRRAFLGAVGAMVLAGCDSGPKAASTTARSSAGSSTPTSTRAAPTSSATIATSSHSPTSTRSTTAATGSTASPSTTSPTSATPSSATPATSSRTAAGRPDYAALARSLDGDLVLPDDKAYRQAAELFNPRFDDVHPQAVARCSSPADVAECVSFARTSGVPLAIRSGGHCYEGWSVGPGLVIDTRPIHAVRTGPGTATVGAGAHRWVPART